MPNAYSTKETELQVLVGEEFEQVYRIQSYPDLGSEPSTIDITDLDSQMKEYIEGLQDVGGALAFPCRLTAEMITAVEELMGTVHTYRVINTQSGIYAQFDGTISYSIAGGGVDEMSSGNIYIVPEEMTFGIEAGSGQS
jgi:hypothetical protein